MNERNGVFQVRAEKYKVLVVDDSPVMRGLLQTIITGDDAFEVVGTAENPIDAREKIRHLHPDMLTLDVEMPRMNGIEFLSLVMRLRPMPVVMVSSLTQQGAQKTLEALETGAFDALGKPDLAAPDALENFAARLLETLHAAGEKLRPVRRAANAMPMANAPRRARVKLMALGASTGGVEAIRTVLSELPPTLPPLIITQHMPPGFLASFATRLNQYTDLTVMLAEEGMPLERGAAYIAPGERHMEVVRKDKGFAVRLVEKGRVSGHIPSVDVMFHSVAAAAPGESLGVLLTGMGADGAQGLLAMHRAGAHTIGQSEASCVVYGMPRRALELGAVQQELALKEIVPTIKALCQERAA